jgi:hypothetical protein
MTFATPIGEWRNLNDPGPVSTDAKAGVPIRWPYRPEIDSR